ncbi:hypothetical protein NFJ68_11470 [Klebsiella aerogenes]|uniref:hypothetical protein n=1 Tax=Klebsiella aerogenes TaxID=548 RepID=UPI0013C366BA|nr:hypothetical protein [Klebsiella aerogenes]WFW29018.1 hypothetical protein NFJ68_11470 [Klebsiella aerogenes]HDS2646020.1 hypothetical protein [Klebsiella aerogenes]HDU5923146.1 hypothetical protein [Klebsiella aerogenes]
MADEYDPESAQAPRPGYPAGSSRCRPDKAQPPSGIKAGAGADEYDPESAQAPRPGYR